METQSVTVGRQRCTRLGRGARREGTGAFEETAVSFKPSCRFDVGRVAALPITPSPHPFPNVSHLKESKLPRPSLHCTLTPTRH